MKKFVLTVVPVLVVLSMLLTACGGGTATTPAPTTSAGTSTEAAPTQATAPTEAPTMAATGAVTDTTTITGTGTVTGTGTTTGTTTTGGTMTLPASCSGTVALNYWNPFTGPDGPFMGQLVDSFNAANPNIAVTMTTQSEYMTQYQTAAAAGTMADVVVVNEDVVGTAAFRNLIRPMSDDLVTAMGLTADDFPQVAWDAGEVAGSRYAIPLSFVAMTMFYNEDMLKAAGIAAPPTTGEEFAAAAAALTTGDQKGFNITGGFPVQQIFQMLLHQFGGSEFSADYTEATWNSDAGVQALQWMKDAQTKYSEPNLEVDAELNAFKAGTAAMVWNGIWQLSNLTGEGVEFAGKATSVPQIGTQPAVWAGGPLLALGATQNPDPCKDAAAGMFIRYLIDNSVEWAKAGNIPAYNEARSSAEFMELPQSVIAPSLDNPVFPPPVPGISDAFAPLGEAVGSIMNGTATDIKATLDDAAARANEILEQNRATYGDAPTTQ